MGHDINRGCEHSLLFLLILKDHLAPYLSHRCRLYNPPNAMSPVLLKSGTLATAEVQDISLPAV
jgi:hypothetical protein